MSTEPDPARLARHWVHSHEEDRGGLMVFRPGDYSFPPARGRQGFTLLEGGRTVVDAPGADDRPTSAAGRWRVQGGHLSIEAPGWSGEFEIESVEEDRLVVRR